MPAPLIKFENISFRKYQYNVFSDTNWEMLDDENWAVTGANGSGKTTFLEAVEGRLMKTKGKAEYHLDGNTEKTTDNPHPYIASVYFNDRTVNYRDFYYQQRYHATETDGIITVRDFLKIGEEDHLPIIKDMRIDRLLDMEIIKLSNGQFKKMLIAKALLKNPRLLLLDNLYTGLDQQARGYISDVIERIIRQGTNIIMAVDRHHIPSSVNRVMEIDHFSIKRISSRHQYLVPEKSRDALPPLPALPANDDQSYDIIVALQKVSVVYNGKIILDHIDWTIRQNEKWALMGPNGAGKSMLLSLIFADNPQAYANRIVLFDRKRGTGESIWEIKDRIGFVSPEMHMYFQPDKTCREVALSGVSENPYKKTEITEEKNALLDALFGYFSIDRLKSLLFQRVSTGQQNIILLIRAMLKNPPVLILDEPFQGMDSETVRLARHLIDGFSKERTLITVSHQPEELPACIGHCLYIESPSVVKIIDY